ncbi:hypothetical protein GEMRC1_001930 [Eukaryota sp. GEM-RC1]
MEITLPSCRKSTQNEINDWIGRDSTIISPPVYLPQQQETQDLFVDVEMFQEQHPEPMEQDVDVDQTLESVQLDTFNDDVYSRNVLQFHLSNLSYSEAVEPQQLQEVAKPVRKSRKEHPNQVIDPYLENFFDVIDRGDQCSSLKRKSARDLLSNSVPKINSEPIYSCEHIDKRLRLFGSPGNHLCVQPLSDVFCRVFGDSYMSSRSGFQRESTGNIEIGRFAPIENPFITPPPLIDFSARSNLEETEDIPASIDLLPDDVMQQSHDVAQF